MNLALTSERIFFGNDEEIRKRELKYESIGGERKACNTYILYIRDEKLEIKGTSNTDWNQTEGQT